MPRCRPSPASSRASRSRSATTCWRASRRSTARLSSRCSAKTWTCCGASPARCCARSRRCAVWRARSWIAPVWCRRCRSRSVAASAVFIQGRDMGGIVDEMQQRVQAAVHMPAGYFTIWGGEFENQQRAMARLSVIVPISVLLIFVLLFNAFGSVKHAALILLNVPFALVGGIVALYVTGIHLSVSAAIGFIALFGQAVLNGVVMVSYFNQLRQAGMDARSAAFDGALVRLRTVLMTTLLAMLGLTPMALSHAIGSEVQRPLAVVIIGGLFSAAALTLLVLPALYVMFEGRQPLVGHAVEE